MAYCNKCGKEAEEGDTFCHACGASIAAPGEAAGTEPPQAASSPPLPPGSPPVAVGTAPLPPVAVPVYTGQPEGESPQEIAERRVRQRMELWWHLGSYIIVNIFLVIIWAITGAGYPWFIWVMIGWGIGIAFHIMHYFITIHGESRRERMVQKEMGKLQRKQGSAEEPQPPEEA